MIEMDLDRAFHIEYPSNTVETDYLHVNLTHGTTPPTLQVLSDESMRARYDQFGEAGLGGMGGSL